MNGIGEIAVAAAGRVPHLRKKNDVSLVRRTAAGARSSYWKRLIALVRRLARAALQAYARLNGLNTEYSETIVDVRIAKLVGAMNSARYMRTIDSCEGHVGKLFSPYVSFQCSVRTARRIERALRSKRKALSASWQVEGVFCERDGLVFRLAAPVYDHASQSLLQSFVSFWLRRNLIDRDFETIAELIMSELNFSTGKRIEKQEPKKDEQHRDDHSNCST